MATQKVQVHRLIAYIVAGITLIAGEGYAHSASAAVGAEHSWYETSSDPGEALEVKSPQGATNNLARLLGDARFYGITADTVDVTGDAQTNMAVINLDAGQQSGTDLTETRQPWVVSHLDGKFTIKGTSAVLTSPESVYDNITKADRGDLIHHEVSSEEAKQYVTDLLDSARVTGADLLARGAQDQAQPEFERGQTVAQTTLDFTQSGPGVKYVDIEDAIPNFNALQSEGLVIEKNKDQTIVFNSTKTSINLQKFKMINSGVGLVPDDILDGHHPVANTDTTVSSLVWNFPNATDVAIKGSIFGIVLAPEATVDIASTSAGWLVANDVTAGSGEWHYIWQRCFTPTYVTFQGKKTLDGGTSDLQQGAYHFVIKDAVTGDVVKDVLTGEEAIGTNDVMARSVSRR